MPTPRIDSNCDHLDPSDVERVMVFMASVTHAFEVADPNALEELSHIGGDPRGRNNSFEFNQSLMEGGDKVRAWTARPYSEPNWDIFQLVRHRPEPTIWIDVTLNDGQRDYPFCFACSPNAEGVLRSCYYVDR